MSIAWRGPDGNVTGFMNFEYGMSGKWLELLIALWRLVTTGEVPDGVELRPAA
jgi:hypothetical protein